MPHQRMLQGEGIMYAFGGLSIPKQEFGVATHLADVFGYQPVDGILGLGWPALAVDK
ncbi:hypothetical protein TELCIR_24722, partial [Teladorsagia circumcincta]